MNEGSENKKKKHMKKKDLKNNQGNDSKKGHKKHWKHAQNQKSKKTEKEPSKLSLGPRDPYNKTYVRNDEAIRRALVKGLAKRRINLRANEIYKSARITAPTFYLHCRDANDALRSYEKALQKRFLTLLPKNVKRDLAIALLFEFIYKNRRYFAATTQVCDTYVLTRLLYKIRPILIGKTRVNDKIYAMYVNAIIAFILCWIKYEDCSRDTVELYTRKVIHLRLMNYGI